MTISKGAFPREVAEIPAVQTFAVIDIMSSDDLRAMHDEQRTIDRLAKVHIHKRCAVCLIRRYTLIV